MKAKLQKAISILLTALMIVSVCPTTILADSNEEYSYKTVAEKDGVTYVELTSYRGTSNSITLPTKINENVVVGLNYNFGPNSSYKPSEIIVPEGYDYIGGFRGFNNLSITLPSSLKMIDYYSFQSTTIKSINFPEGLEAIGFDAFMGVSFTNTDIVLPDSLKYIDCRAFNSSNITSIHLGKNVNYVSMSEYKYGVDLIVDENIDNLDDVYSFIGDCKSLTEITVEEENPYFSVEDNVLLSKDKSLLWTYPAGLEKTDYKVPSSVRIISSNAFYGASFNSFILSNTVSEIHRYSFRDLSADNFIFEDNCALTEIPIYSFYYSSINSKLVIPNTIKMICASSFYNSSILEIDFQENSQCTEIGQYAFKNSTIEKITIPSSVDKMGESDDSSVFSNCSKLSEVIFEDNSRVTYWGKKLFENCSSLTKITIGKNSMLKTIYCNFSNTAITDFDFSNCFALSSLSSDCFKNNTKILSIDLSNTNLYEISSSFSGAKNLQRVVLPDCLYKLSGNAFANCTSIEEINADNVMVVSDTAFTGCKNISVPTSKSSKNNGEFYYYEFDNSITIGRKISNSYNEDIVIPSEIEGKPVTRIAENAFSNIEVNSLTIPDTITIISEYAFKNSIIDEGIVIPENVTFIGKYAFSNYQNLEVAYEAHTKINTQIKIPNSIKIINPYVFQNSKLTDIAIGENVRIISAFAFYGSCVNAFDIPDSVVILEKFCLNGLELKTVNFGANVNDIEDFVITSFSNPSFKSTPQFSFIYKYPSYPEEYNVSSEHKEYTSVDGVIYDKALTTLVAFPCDKDGNTLQIPTSVNTLGSYSFSSCRNTERMIIPNTINTICDNSFTNSISIKSVFIPNSVGEIGESAFESSKALSDVQFDNNMELCKLDLTFGNCTELNNVSFGENCKIEYLIDTFYQSGLEYIDLNCVAKVLLETFMDSSLKEVTLHEGIEYIDFGTFAGTQIERIVIPKSTSRIGGRAFEDCSSLKYVNLSNVHSLEYAAFKNCISLESIDLTGVYYLGGDCEDRVFYGCDNLKKFYFTAEEKDAYIAENEFEGNEALETIVIGSSIAEIQSRAFADCTNLQTAYIASEVEEISDSAFDNCDMLTIVCMYNSPAMSFAIRNSIPYETFVIAPIPDQEYTGKAITPPLNVTQAGKALALDKDYSAVYSNNINVGTARVTVTGLGDYSIFGSTGNFKIVKTTPDEPPKNPDNTKPVTTTKPNSTTAPSSTTKPVGNTTTTSASSTNSKQENTASQKTTKAKATSPTGAKKVNGVWVNKKQKKTSIKKLKKAKKSFKVYWKKASGISGYQIQYSTDKKFKRNTKSLYAKKAKTSLTVKKLKAKKKYYVRIRTYKNVKLNGKTVKVYSSWSKARSVKTAK